MTIDCRVRRLLALQNLIAPLWRRAVTSDDFPRTEVYAVRARAVSAALAEAVSS